VRTPFDLIIEVVWESGTGRPVREITLGARATTDGGTDMKYMLLIYHDEQTWNQLT